MKVYFSWILKPKVPPFLEWAHLLFLILCSVYADSVTEGLWRKKRKFIHTHTQTHTVTHLSAKLTPTCTVFLSHTQTSEGSAVWLINSFLSWGGVMSVESSQSPQDQRVTPLINWARWNVKHWIWCSLPLFLQSFSASCFFFSPGRG